ncbi:MAG: hypothetical protein JRH20_23780 [Deltaproteobacteria bacterium]|nr:hypothetical protein [Deltaproteobacteria bacterium]
MTKNYRFSFTSIRHLPARWALTTLLAVSFFGLGGCATAPKASPTAPKATIVKTEPAKHQADASKTPKPAPAKPLSAADPSRVLASAVWTHSVTSTQLVLSKIKPQLPAILQPVLTPAMAQLKIAPVVGMAGMADQIDFARPLGMILIAPEEVEGMPRWEQQLVTSVAIKDLLQLEGALQRKFSELEELGPNHYRVVRGNHQRLFMVVGKRLFSSSSQELLPHAMHGLGQAFTQAKREAIRVELKIAHAYKRYQPMVDMGLGLLQAAGNNKTGVTPQTKRMLAKLNLVRDTDTLVLSLKHPRGGFQVLGQATALAGQKLEGWLKTLPHGPVWGAQFLPGRPIVAGFAHEDKRGEVKQMMEWFRSLIKGGKLPRWFKGLDKLMTQSKAYYALSTGRKGGGFFGGGAGSAQQQIALYFFEELKSEEAGRNMSQGLFKSFAKFSSKLLPLLIRENVGSQDAALKKALKGLRISARYHVGRVKLDGAKGDLYELRVRWPKAKKGSALAEAKGAFTKLFGKKATAGLAVLPQKGGKGLFVIAIAKDSKKALQVLATQVKSRQQTAISKRVQAMVGSTRQMGFGYLDVAAMVEHWTPLRALMGKKATAEDLQLIAKLLPRGGKDPAPLVISVSRDDRQVSVKANLSPKLVDLVARSVGALVMTRMAGGVLKNTP